VTGSLRFETLTIGRPSLPRKLVGQRVVSQFSRSATATPYRNLACMRLGSALIAIVLMSLGCQAKKESNTEMSTCYLEIVSEDVDNVAAFYERVHGLSFGPPDPDLGQARVATRTDGALVGIRKPLAAHEQPIMRTYFAVDDIQQAVKKAEGAGATIAYGPTRQGQRGTFAIVFQGGVQHGLWQR
jgi:predicted enzyme related to lactoylglutathione lyase